ncbi:MAG: hypothetical protein K2X74_01695, partial [Acetobacteraceae bacterium]|nr:hypothetical protein [Acetobacteraceae bacterium]
MSAPPNIHTRGLLLAGVTALGLLAAPIAASAAPYAYASNQITNLSVTFAGPGGTTVPITSVQSNATQVQAGASFGASSTPTLTGNGTVGSPLDLPAPGFAFAGPGPAPADNLFAPAGPPGTFTGSRADAFISGGTAGNVSVSNVAEGYG